MKDLIKVFLLSGVLWCVLLLAYLGINKIHPLNLSSTAAMIVGACMWYVSLPASAIIVMRLGDR